MRLKKAITDIINSPACSEEKLDLIRTQISFEYQMIIEYYDDLMENELEDRSKTDVNELLDNRIKAQKIVDWANALPSSNDVAAVIEEFHALPKVDGDSYG